MSQVLCDLIRVYQESEALVQQEAALFDAEKTDWDTRIASWTQKKEELFFQELEHSKKRQNINSATHAMQYITGIASIGLGMSTGGVAGVLLVASGTVGLANRILQDSRCVQDTTTLEKIDRSATSLQIGLALFGGFAAWKLGSALALNSYQEALKQTSTVIQTSATLMQATLTVAKEAHNKQTLELQADMKMLEAQITSAQHTLSQNCAHLETILGSTQSEADSLQKCIKQNEVHQ